MESGFVQVMIVLCRAILTVIADWGGSPDDMKTTAGYCFKLGSRVFSWCSKK